MKIDTTSSLKMMFLFPISTCLMKFQSHKVIYFHKMYIEASMSSVWFVVSLIP